MTKGLTKRIGALEKKVKKFEKNEVLNKLTIEKIINHIKRAEKGLFRLDILNIAISKVLIKNKLITRKKLDNMCNKEVEKIRKEGEKQAQEKMNKMTNSKETLKKEIEKKKKIIN